MNNLPVYKLQEAREYGVLDGLSIVGLGSDKYKIFYSLDESVKDENGCLVVGFVGKRRVSEVKEYASYDAVMTDIQKIIGGSPRVLNVWPHDNPGAEVYLEESLGIYEPVPTEFSLKMTERDLP